MTYKSVSKSTYSETPEERYKRYDKAQNRLITYWDETLKDIYRYCIPNRYIWDSPTEGESKTRDIYDDTAVLGVQSFASNLVSFLMPPFKEFVSLGMSISTKNDARFSDNDKKDIEDNLNEQVTIVFEYLNESGYSNAFHEAFQDLAAGTGIIIINEGDDTKPFSFSSVPLAEVAVEEGPNGMLENFWRTKKYSMRQIVRIWPGATLSKELENLLKNNPDEEIEIIEGVIFYPDNKEDAQYFYYVQHKALKDDIYTEFRDYSPFLGFRFGKTPGEVMGRGPALLGIDFIRILNLLAEYDLRSAKFDAFPAYTVPNTSIINANTMVLEPGAIIPIDSTFAGQQPIQPLPTSNSKDRMQMRIEQYQQIVKDFLASEPLPDPQDQKNSTATESNIRYNEWVRKNSSSAARLQDELINPFFNVLFKILRKKALIKDIETSKGIIEIKINNKLIKLIYDSPIINMQRQDELQAMDQLMIRLNQAFQMYGIMALDFVKLPIFWAEKLKADISMVKNPSEIKMLLGGFAQNMLQAQQQAQQQGQQQQGGPQQQPSPDQSNQGGMQ